VFRLELRPDEADVPLALATFQTRASHAVITSLDGPAQGVARAIVIGAGSSVGVESVGRYRVQAGGTDVVVQPFDKPEWALSIGTDGWGLWAEFAVMGQRSSVAQRLRWIASGEFLMGSPKSEKSPYFNEHQHRVVLTQGYWLADTACTQELWEAVMGENPSHFKDDPQNPVERVSWNDITQKFLPRLNELVPGLNLTLPTEAQWEHACRAGTTTPFSFGDRITPEQVNYDGNYPYAGGKRGEYRNKTVPVKALPANPWGIYQMHGNVWELCMNEFAAYPEGTSIDPGVHQDKKEKDRYRVVIRGGSWINRSVDCRSANRHPDGPDDRGHTTGFRLARGLADQPTPTTL
jgi:formylglycine-generating enzyme required for sulfatase activity